MMLCGVPEPEACAIVSWHSDVTYHIRSSNGEEKACIDTKCGIRQGCPIAPTIWIAFMHLVLTELSRRYGASWLQEHISLFADDTHMGWTFTTEKELFHALSQAGEVLELLESMGLTINAGKSAFLCVIGGRTSKKIRDSLFQHSSGKTYINVGCGKHTWKFPVVHNHKYLGTSIGYGHFEDDTLEMRIRQAMASYHRLRQTLHSNRFLSLRMRVRLWRSIVFTSLEYGLESAGLTHKGAKRLRTFVIRQLRSIAKSPVHITKESNAALLSRLGVVDPVTYLRQGLERTKCRTDLLRHSLLGEDARLHSSIVARELQLLHDFKRLEMHGQDEVTGSILIACQECGREFSNMAALNAHRRKEHQFIKQPMTTKMQKRVDRFSHSVDGLPICRHCGRKFSGWPLLLQHIGGHQCPALHNAARSPGLNPLSDPDVQHAGDNERVLSAPNAMLATLKAQDLRSLRHGGLSLGHLSQRCHLCNQWMAHPHFVKTHIRRSHDEYWQRHEHTAQLLAKQYAFVLGTNARCYFCNAQVRCKTTHAWHCPIFFQLCMAVAANELKNQKNLRQISLEQLLGQPTVRRPLRLSAVGLAVMDTMKENIDVPPPALAVELTAKCCFCDVDFRHVREVKHHYKHRHSMLWSNHAEQILLSCAKQRPKRPCEHCQRRYTSGKAAHASVCPGLFQWWAVHHMLESGHVEVGGSADAGGLWRGITHVQPIPATGLSLSSSGSCHGKGGRQDGGGVQQTEAGRTPSQMAAFGGEGRLWQREQLGQKLPKQELVGEGQIPPGLGPDGAGPIHGEVSAEARRRTVSSSSGSLFRALLQHGQRGTAHPLCNVQEVENHSRNREAQVGYEPPPDPHHSYAAGVASLFGQDGVRPDLAESLPGFGLADDCGANGVVLPTVGSGEEGGYDPERSNSLSGEEVSGGCRALEAVDGTPQCLSQVSCHETAGRAVSVGSSGILADSEPEPRGSQRGYVNLGQNIGVLCQPYNRIENPPREAAEAAFGVATGADAIHKIVLKNAGNYCYANSCQEPRDVGGSLAALFKLLVKAADEDKSFHIKSLMPAQVLFTGWSHPERQHDVSEFIHYVLVKVQPMVFRGHWQARRILERDAEITDSGTTLCPISIPVPGDGSNIQHAIDAWHNQEALFALSVVPHCLILQLGRFQYDAAGVRKLQQRVSLDANHFHMPVLANTGLEILHIEYCISSIVFHLGSRTNEGHYRNLLYDRRLRCWLATEDNCAAWRADAADLMRGQTDSYLVFCHRVHGMARSVVRDGAFSLGDAKWHAVTVLPG